LVLEKISKRQNVTALPFGDETVVIKGSGIVGKFTQVFDNMEQNLVKSQRSSTSAAVAAAPATTQTRRGESRYSGLAVSTVKYLLRTEVHTFAFSVAANAILSFFPFVLLLMTLVRRVFHSRVMAEVITELLRDYLPAGQEFVIRNLNALVEARHRAQLVSLLILLITSTGIFMPLEVALNRIWNFPSNRSYLGNQVISLGLAFACGVLALISIALTAGNVALIESLLHGHAVFLVRLAGFLIMKIFAITASIGIFFLIYWLLPNGKVPVRAVLPTAVLMGLLSETLKYAYILALPRLNFQEVYGPFALSVSLMFWAFLSGLLLLTGAHLSAQEQTRRNA
jgi:YihY family inner membrane protein